jgi:hypothetical protein
MKKNLHSSKKRHKLKCFLPNLNSMKILQKHLVCIILITGLLQNSVAQYRPAPSAGLPNPQLPTPTVPIPQVPNLQNMMWESQQRIQQQNNNMIQEDMRQYELRQQQAKSIIDEATREFQTVSYEFPDNSHFHATKYFRESLAEITEMLEGKKEMSLKKAVFLTENAYLENSRSYDWFCSDLNTNVDLIQSFMKKEGLAVDDDISKKYMLQRFLADTLTMKDDKGNHQLTHLPFKYDFEDPFGKKDWSKMFVTKLLSDKKGQCHSMPLLYLMLADELKIKAWMSYSPQHSYIKVQGDKDIWYSYETTNGNYSTDSWVQSSGLVKSEALKSGIYMDTLSRKETIAATLADLAKGYAIKFGFDKFVLDCVNKALEYHPNNAYALQIKADYYTLLFGHVRKQLNFPPKERIHLYPKANEILQKMYANYDYLDRIGFETMTEEAYKSWIKSFETEKGKQPVKIIRP